MGGFFDLIKAQATAILTGAGPEAEGGQGLAGVVIEVGDGNTVWETLVQRSSRRAGSKRPWPPGSAPANLPVTAEQLPRGHSARTRSRKLAGRVGLSPGTGDRLARASALPTPS